MPHLKHLLATVLALVVLPCVADGPPPLGVVARGQCVRVVDGDTIDVAVVWTIRVRLADCWAPERNTAAGERAARDLSHYAARQPVIVQIATEEARGLSDLLTLGRVVGRVWLRGASQSFSEWQVSQRNASTRKGLPVGQ